MEERCKKKLRTKKDTQQGEEDKRATALDTLSGSCGLGRHMDNFEAEAHWRV
jgi:hypothetical protein